MSNIQYFKITINLITVALITRGTTEPFFENTCSIDQKRKTLNHKNKGHDGTFKKTRIVIDLILLNNCVVVEYTQKIIQKKIIILNSDFSTSYNY